MLFTLHVPTLLFATALVVAVAGVLLIISSGTAPGSRAFRLWSAAMLCGAVGLGLLATAPTAGPWANMVGATAILIGTTLSWSGARLFVHRPTIPGLAILGPAIFIAATINRDPASVLGPVIVFCSGGIYTLAAAWELWRGRVSKLRLRDAAMVLLAVHGSIHLARGVSLALAPSHPALSAPAVGAALLIESLTHTVAMALLLLALLKEQNLQERLEEARRLALMDGLTGLGNRRLFDEAIEREAARAVRERRRLALLMVDADHFKRINDAFGHAAGDDCLRAIGGAIPRALRRPGDLVCRFGGEEFTVLLPDTDEAGAEAVAAAIHEAIAALKLVRPEGYVTVSIGIGLLVPGIGSGRAATLLRAADSALYAAKALGRNRTEVAGAPAPGGSLARPRF